MSRRKHPENVRNLACHYRDSGLSRSAVQDELGRRGFRVSSGWLSDVFAKARLEQGAAAQRRQLAAAAATPPADELVVWIPDTDLEAHSEALTELRAARPDVAALLDRTTIVDALSTAGLIAPAWFRDPRALADLAIDGTEFPGHIDDAEPGEGERERRRAIELLESALQLVRSEPMTERWRATP
jgi:hypothetical protein